MPDRERERVLGALELGDRLLERADGRIGVAAVELVGTHAVARRWASSKPVGLPHARRPQRGRQRRSARTRVRPGSLDSLAAAVDRQVTQNSLPSGSAITIHHCPCSSTRRTSVRAGADELGRPWSACRRRCVRRGCRDGPGS